MSRPFYLSGDLQELARQKRPSRGRREKLEG